MRNLKRHITLILTFVALLSAHAATMDELRKLLEKTTDPVTRTDIMVDMYNKSLTIDDMGLQVRCLNELINYCHATKQYDRESGAIRNRIVYFFNNDMNDSVIYHVPRDMRTLSNYQKWTSITRYGLPLPTPIYIQESQTRHCVSPRRCLKTRRTGIISWG